MAMTDVEIKDKLAIVASLSTCKDKHVAAIAMLNNVPVSAAFNVRDPNCDGDCDAHKCVPTHAEHEIQAPRGSTVYITLYPCVNCQRRLYNLGVEKVIVYNTKHKEDLGIIPIELRE